MLIQLLVLLIRTLTGYLLAAGQVLSARHTVEWGLRLAPASADLWSLRGRILLRLTAGGTRWRGDAAQLLEEARTAYARAADLRPRDPEIWREHGLVLQNLAWVLAVRGGGTPRPDLLGAAAAEYTRVLDVQPRRAEVLHERAMTRAGLRAGLPDAEALGWLEAALADLDRSLDLRPHAPEVALHRAEVRSDLAGIHHRAGRKALEVDLRRAGLEDCARALRLRPGWQPLLLRQGREATALAAMGDDPAKNGDLAIAATTTVLREQPRHLQALIARSQARVAAACRLCVQGDARAALVWRQALTDLDAALEAAGLRGREEIIALRGGALAQWAEAQDRAGDGVAAREAWQAAVEAFDQAVDDDPADARRLAGRAAALACLADRAEPVEQAVQLRRRAVLDFGQALALRPDDAAALAGRAMARCGPVATAAEARQALGEADHALTLYPEHAGVRGARRHCLLALIVALPSGPERGDVLATTLGECALGLAAAPTDPLAHYDHARVLFLSGRAAEAYRALEQAIHLAPGLRLTARRDPVWGPVAAGAGFRRLIGE